MSSLRLITLEKLKILFRSKSSFKKGGGFPIALIFLNIQVIGLFYYFENVKMIILSGAFFTLSKLISYKASKGENSLNTLKLYPLFFDRKKTLFYNISSDFLIKLTFALPLLLILTISNVVFHYKLVLLSILISDFIVSFIYADIATSKNNKYINFVFKIGIIIFAVSTSFPFGIPNSGISENKLNTLSNAFLFGTLTINLILMIVGIILFKKRKDIYVF